MAKTYYFFNKIYFENTKTLFLTSFFFMDKAFS